MSQTPKFRRELLGQAEMKLAGVTYEDLAAAAHVSLSAIYKYRDGRRVPSSTVAAYIAQRLGVSCDEIMNLVPMDRTPIGR